MKDTVSDCLDEQNRQVHKCHTQKPENKEDEAPLVYTARDLADAYVEGFKDGFNTAIAEQHNTKKDVEGYG
jgi:hypothetical protein